MAAVQKVTVGPATMSDPTLARASLEASQILRAAVSLPRAQRDAYVDKTLAAKYAASVVTDYKKAIPRLMGKGAPRDQAVFDAMRYAIAYFFLGQLIRVANAAKAGALSGLGDTGQDACCAIDGVLTTVGATLFAALGKGTTATGGSAAVTAGGATIAGACDCSHTAETAAAAASNAQAAASAAQANVQIAQANAQAAAAQAQATAAAQAASSSSMVRIALIGGGVVGVLGLAYLVLK